MRWERQRLQRGGNSGTTGGGGGSGGGYTGVLTATPDVLHAAESFDVRGWDYNTDYGYVIVGFTGGSWGSPLDSNGCFEITDIQRFPATHCLQEHTT
jgi:hypothetical protein